VCPAEVADRGNVEQSIV
jgi:hypothetical protein